MLNISLLLSSFLCSHIKFVHPFYDTHKTSIINDDIGNKNSYDNDSSYYEPYRWHVFFFYVTPVGLEPTRSFEHVYLKHACIPFQHGAKHATFHLSMVQRTSNACGAPTCTRSWEGRCHSCSSFRPHLLQLLFGSQPTAAGDQPINRFPSRR